jgi:hypothetical protein
MNLALGILFGWLGAALLWVSFHGLDSGASGPGGVISTLEKNVTAGAVT